MQNLFKNRPWKKAISVILSLIIAFGTFITITFGSSAFQKWLGVKAMLSAYAADIVNTDGVAAVNEEAMLANDHTISLENGDGSNTVYIFTEPISFTDENGDLKTKDISVEKSDNSLKARGYEYTNGQNDYRINFSTDINKGIEIEYNGLSYSISPQYTIDVNGAETVAEYLNENFEVFQYKNLYGNGTNLRYYPQLNGVKDEIVLNQSINKNTFSFELKTNNCSALLNQDGTVSIVDENGNAAHTFAAPYAYDSAYVEGDDNEHVTDCSYSLIENESGSGSYILTVNVNNDWLESENTVYPVIIDPVTEHLSQNKDAYVSSKHPNANYETAQTLCLGKTTENGTARVFTHFSIPDEIQDYATINSAAQWERETTGRTETTNVCAYLVNATWQEDDLKWTHQPGVDSEVNPTPDKNLNSQSTDKPNYPLWYKFNITNIVQAIVGKNNVNKNNYGLVFKAKCETNSYERWRTFASREYSSSSYRPYTVISYTNDTTAPTVNVSKNPPGYTNGNVTITVDDSSYSDGNGSGKSATPYAFSTSSNPSSFTWGTATTKPVSDNSTWYVGVRDKAHNVRIYPVNVDNIDRTAPVAAQNSTYSLSTNEFTAEPVTVTFPQITDSQSGLNQTPYSFSEAENSFSWTNEPSVTVDSNKTLYLYARDAVNNIRLIDICVINNIDSLAPVVNSADVVTDSSSGNSELNIVAGDDVSGICAYSLNGGSSWVDLPEELTGTKALNYSVQLSQSDLNGNLDVRVKDITGRISSGEIVELSAPEFYDYNGLIGIYNPNQNSLGLEYKIGQNGEWVNYKTPIELTEESRVYARIRGSKHKISRLFTPAINENSAYEISETEIIITNNNLEFEISRDYSSADNSWDFSTMSRIETTDNANYINAYMPSGEKLVFVKTGENSYRDELYGCSLSVTSRNYIITDDDIVYEYNITSKRLEVIFDEMNCCIEFSYTQNNELEMISAYENGDPHEYLVSESNGKIESITTPLNETLVYDYSSSGLASVYYDHNTLQFSRNSDIILSEYEYTNGKLSKDNGNTVNYNENGAYVSLTTPAGETIVNETEPEEEQDEEPSVPEPQYTYFNGTDIIETETFTETVDGKTTVTVNTYDNSSRLVSVSVTSEGYSSLTSYTYYSTTDKVHTQIETETENGSTSQSEYTYDEYGRITEENISSNGKTTETEYEYNVWGYEEFVTVVETENGICTNSSTAFYEYDALGRCISEVYSDFNTDNEQTLYAYNPLDDVIFEKVGNEVTRTVYDDYGRVVQEIEAQDYSASSDGISLDNDGYPTGSDSYTNPNAGRRYVYDSQTRVLTSETNRLGVQTDYTYHPNSSTVATESFDIYRYEYTTNGKLEYIYVADSATPYARYVYSGDNVTEVRYGNGQTVYYAYNDNGNVISQSYTGRNEVNPVTQFTYTYNTDNELTSKTDCINHRRTDYSGNTVSVYNVSGNSDVLLYSYAKTEEDTAQSLPATETKSFAGNTLNISYSESSNQYKLNNSDVFSVSNTFNNDELLSSTVINSPSNTPIVTKSYSYDNDNNVTGLTVNNTSVSYVYENGKISEYHQGNNAAYYRYDNKEQLVREDINYVNYSRTITYTYDNRGNLTEKKEYQYTRNENPGTPLEENGLEFEYEGELWLDEIVETPTETILYDENGNPVNLEDCTLEWTNGRQLKSVSDGNSVIFEYTYDENGIRVSKTYQGVTTYYTTENGIITSQYQLDNQGNKENEVIFVYDNGVLVSAYYNNSMYYYITNAMGDVIGIIDESGNTVVEYCYDAWGNTVDKTVNTNLSTDFASVNPMLYRSYYFDEDLGVYYLQSRYYKSDWCRFINSDLPIYAILQKNIECGLNLFAYCCNEPIQRIDKTGTLFAELAIGGISVNLIACILLFSILIFAVVYAFSSNTVSLPNISIEWPEITLPSINNRTEISVIDTTIPARRNNSKKEYIFCYMNKNGKKCNIKPWMSWSETMIALGIIETTTDFNYSRSINYGGLNNSGNTALNANEKCWGIYASSQSAAKTLAVALGGGNVLECRKNGGYFHYHDGKHRIHIWFGKKQRKGWAN